MKKFNIFRTMIKSDIQKEMSYALGTGAEKKIDEKNNWDRIRDIRSHI